MGTNPTQLLSNSVKQTTQINSIDIDENTGRRNSVDSVESLESNPAQFSDEENHKMTSGYDPMQA